MVFLFLLFTRLFGPYWFTDTLILILRNLCSSLRKSQRIDLLPFMSRFSFTIKNLYARLIILRTTRHRDVAMSALLPTLPRLNFMSLRLQRDKTFYGVGIPVRKFNISIISYVVRQIAFNHFLTSISS